MDKWPHLVAEVAPEGGEGHGRDVDDDEGEAARGEAGCGTEGRGWRVRVEGVG
jgi:hypothetical protein